ncbi:MAG: hypothetical protein JW834_03120 [Candidatus Diapherotrites archaeon]|nr:hypothetical protein [Candidatus Diapherotrites archaeon]
MKPVIAVMLAMLIAGCIGPTATLEEAPAVPVPEEVIQTEPELQPEPEPEAEPEPPKPENPCAEAVKSLYGSSSSNVSAAAKCFEDSETYLDCVYYFLARAREVELEKNNIGLDVIPLYSRALRCAVLLGEDSPVVNLKKNIDGYYSCYEGGGACWFTAEEMDALIEEVGVS